MSCARSRTFYPALVTNLLPCLPDGAALGLRPNQTACKEGEEHQSTTADGGIGKEHHG